MDRISYSYPIDAYARIAPSFGLAAKQFTHVGAGVSDADYHGHLVVVLFNNAHEKFCPHQGDRISQLILENFPTPAVEEVQELDNTSREPSGFGNTGIQYALPLDIAQNS